MRCKINDLSDDAIDKLLEGSMEEISDELDKVGIAPLDGDCGNFAYALREVFGGDFTCVFDNEDPDNEENFVAPLHCYWNFNEKIWDSRGSHDSSNADEYGDRHSKGGDYTVLDDCFDTCFENIFLKEKADVIIRVVKEVLARRGYVH